jgi:hypothetical protein
MTRMRWVLALDALAQAAEAGDDTIARHVLERADPAVRWLIRRKVQDEIRWAELAVIDRGDRPHVLRLAFLREACLLDDVDLEDRATVAERFTHARKGLPPRRWHRRWGLSLVILAGATIVGLALRRGTRHRFTPLEAPLGAAFGEVMPAYVLEVLRSTREAPELPEDQPRATDRATELRERTIDEVRHHSDPELATDMTVVLDAYDAVATSPRGRLPTHELEMLASSLQQLNADLRRRREPFFVDTMQDPGAGMLLISYYIDRETTVRAEGAPFRLVRVQRLDSWNRAPALVGYTRAELNTALVLLDMVERQLVDIVIPALAPGGAAELVDAASMELDPSWPHGLEERAREIFRSDLRTSRFSDPAAMLRLVAVLSRRQQLFRIFGAAALGDVALRPPARLVTHANVDALEGKVPRSQIREWREIEEELDGAPMRRAFTELREPFARVVDRHEAQHQIDFRRGLIPVPLALRELLGVEETADLPPTSPAVRCRDELSAVLASIAGAPEMSRTVLTIALEPVFNRMLWSTPHAFAAAVILDGLARELGEVSSEPMAAKGGFDRKPAAALYLAVVRHPEDQIVAAARALWERLFEARFPAPEIDPWKVSKEWER